MQQLLYYALLVFMVSFISNATPFFGAAYTIYASLILMSIRPNTVTLILFIAITALGAALSKNIMYLLGVALSRPMAKNRNLKFIRALLKLGFLWVIVVILAVIPGLPLDDYLYVGTGAARVSMARLNAYVLLGKLIKSCIEIPIELTLFNATYSALSMFGLGKLEFQVVFAVIFTAMGIILYKLDWWSIYNWLRNRIKILPVI